MRQVLACVLVGFAACSFPRPPELAGPEDAKVADASPDSPSDATGGGPPPGVVSLSASPSVFVLHQNDSRGTTLTLSNQTSAMIDLAQAFTVSGLVGATMTFSENTCAQELAPGASCRATGNLVATASAQTDFEISLGTASVTLTMTAMAACPTNCGPSGATNCCASTVVPGNAAGATLAGEPFYRSYDVAADQAYPNQTSPAEVSDFRLDTYEVTVGRFRAFVNAGMGVAATAPSAGAGAHARIPGSGWDAAWNANLATDTIALVTAINCSSPAQTWTNNAGNNESLPMNCLTWYDAMAFCIWDGGYLPSEAEWNYAASGGSEQRPFPWSSGGSTAIDCGYTNYDIENPPGMMCLNGAAGATNRVGSESPRGDGRWGHADLAGNLWEWNLDWYAASYQTPCNDCADTTATPLRVIRGGGYSATAPFVRPAYRGDFGTPTRRLVNIGARCARTP